MERLERLDYDTIILGGNLEALLHSYVEGLPLVMVNPQIPFYLDVDEQGVNKSKIWSKLSFYLSYVGLNPLCLKAENYRVEEDRVVVFGKSAYSVEIGYKNIIRYDQIPPSEKLRVFDYIYVNNITVNDLLDISKIKTGDSFVSHFRTNIDKKKNHICAISELTQEQICDDSYGDIYARLKSIDELRKAGIVGWKEINKAGRTKMHWIRVNSLRRDVIPDTREKEDILLRDRKDSKNIHLQKIVKMLGSPYVD